MSSEKAYSRMTSHEEETIEDLQRIVKYPNYQVKDIYKILRELKVKLSPVKRQLIKSHFKDVKREKPWTLSDIAYALALSRKGFKSYNFIRDCIPLPSRDEIQSVTKNIQFNPGINQQLLKILSKRISEFHVLGKTCSLIFHEIDLSENVVMDKENGETVGYVNLGSLGCKDVLANRALVFMANGLYAEWKQPIAYYFLRDTIDGATLKHLLIEVITALQSVGFRVLATVFDDRPSNPPFIEDLCYDSTSDKSNYFFKVNNKRVYCLYDPCYLLKSTRNALFEYNIEFDDSKVAKWEYIEKAFERDLEGLGSDYRLLRKMQKEYIYLDQYPEYKKSVEVAALTMSSIMSSGVVMWTKKFVPDPLPTEARDTCKFLYDMNNLFDSFNGSYPEINDDARYRRSMSYFSEHLELWSRLLPQINSWVFVSKDGEIRITEHPLKKAWERTIEVTKELWRDSLRMGATSLPTRNLNKDPLDNLFICLRYFNPKNSNPNCYQFISCLKSLLLNNLKIPSIVIMYHEESEDKNKHPKKTLLHSQMFVRKEDLPTSVTSSDDSVFNHDKVVEYNYVHQIFQQYSEYFNLI